MAYSAPRVQGKRLVIPGRAGPIIIVGTPAWFAWLEQATTFAFGERAILTACKEQDGHGGWHWRAYRDRAGGQRGVYLGKAAEITFDHLNAVAAQLLHDTTAGQRSSGEQHPAAPPSASLRVELLGGFHVYAGDQPVPDNAWRLHKAKSLVKLLALAPGYALHREQAQELLWPDLDPAAAANNLRQALYAARHALGGDQAADSSALQTRDERIHLAPTGGLWVDVAAFTTAAADAREGQDPAAYQTAVALYTGDLLPEDRYEDWAAGRREALCQSYLALLNTLAGLLEDRGDYPAAAATFEQVLAHEPADEEAHTRLMRVYALSGQRTRALRQYTLLRDALRHELDAAPDAASQRLYHAILTRRFPATSATTLPTADPASRALTAARHNLPTPLTSFVGRGRERAALARRLLPSLGDAVTGPRLITLTGAGGVGKSRLALAVANTLAARYPDGVWLVELATLTDPALVPAAVAAALGVNTPGRPLADTLLEHARSKTLLLVLDNCEHLAGACAQLAGTLLAACPRVSLLATSRLALRVPGEVIWRVSPLEAPDPTQAPTLAVLRDVPAVRLFVERARFVQPDFALSAANAAAVTEICRRLDGLPLAIELAAARLAVLSPMQLATRLDSALGLLGDRDQATPAHQRTLRATLDWSYALLGEREQRLLRRLAAFVGGWTLEAAEAVAASAEADGLPPRDVLPLLARLVDHSLVGVEARGDAARYQLLETVRQYAAEQLAASGEIALVEQRHATYYLALAEAAEPQLTGAAQVGWFDRLEREHANLLTALDNLRAAGATESWARLGVALWRFWETRGHLGEGLRRLETIMAAQDVPAVLRGKASSRAASLLRARGDLARSDTLYRQTLALWQDLGEARGAAVALANLGINAEYRSDVTAAAAFHQESLARFTALDDQRGIAAELNNLANIRADAGGLAEATVLYERAITLAHTLGQPPDAYAIGNLGNIAYRRGDYGRAVTRLEEAVALLRQRDDRPMLGHYLRYLGFAWRQYGDPVRAVAAFQEALDIDRALDAHSHWTADVLEGLASLLIAAGHSEDGARLFGAADTVREATTVPRRVFYANLYTHDVAMARAALGETAFATAWAAGRALSWSEAIAAAAIRVEAVTLPAATPPALSPREQQVAALIASGLTNAQIAATLGLSQRTADSHVHHILHKLGATSRATIAAWAANHNPVEAPHDQPLPGMSRHT